MEASETGFKPNNMDNPRKGGFRAAMFVFVMTGLENIGFVANLVSLGLYFFGVMHFDLSGAANTYTNFFGATFLITLVAGFISDTYISRLNTVLICAALEISGYIILTVQAHDKSLRPDEKCLTCQLEGGNSIMFYFALTLLALGWGGVRGSSPALGGDQFDKEHPEEKKQLGSFFNWYLLSLTIGACLGVTFIVWILTRRGWDLGFFVSTLLALAGFVVLACGKPFYRVRVAGESALLRLSQVFVVAFHNRNLPIPDSSDKLYEIDQGGDESVHKKISHTNQFRLLDKAAILAQDTAPEPWRVCTVTQVEELKILIRMLPILASTVLMNTCLAQLQTFSVQQGTLMDLHLGSFKVPPASIPIIPFLFMAILIPLYELIFVPLARRITGHPTGITHLQRVGIGLVLSAISMTIAGVIEVKRKNAFNNDQKQINLFWLSFQFGIFGIADMFTFVGLMEFFYNEAPAGMRSLSTSFSFFTISIGYFLSTVFVNVIEDITRKVTPSKKGWLHGLDLNQNHLELFYWFLAILSCINFLVYLGCTKWYQYRRVDNRELGDQKGDDHIKTTKVLEVDDQQGDDNSTIKLLVEHNVGQQGDDINSTSKVLAEQKISPEELVVKNETLASSVEVNKA